MLDAKFNPLLEISSIRSERIVSNYLMPLILKVEDFKEGDFTTQMPFFLILNIYQNYKSKVLEVIRS